MRARTQQEMPAVPWSMIDGIRWRACRSAAFSRSSNSSADTRSARHSATALRVRKKFRIL